MCCSPHALANFRTSCRIIFRFSHTFCWYSIRVCLFYTRGFFLFFFFFEKSTKYRPNTIKYTLTSSRNILVTQINNIGVCFHAFALKNWSNTAVRCNDFSKYCRCVQGALKNKAPCNWPLAVSYKFRKQTRPYFRCMTHIHAFLFVLNYFAVFVHSCYSNNAAFWNSGDKYAKFICY